MEELNFIGISRFDDIKRAVLKVDEVLNEYSNDPEFDMIISAVMNHLANKSTSRNTFEPIIERMLDRIPDTENKRHESVIYNTLAPSAMEMTNMDVMIEVLKQQSFLKTADGVTLDNWGNDYDLPRYVATRARLLARTHNTEGELHNFPIGTRFMQLGNPISPLFYTMIDTDNGVALLECETVGVLGNSHIGQLQATTPVNNLGLVEIFTIETPAQDLETDESYRRRLVGRIRHTGYGGNVPQYQEWVERIDGVGGVVVFPGQALGLNGRKVGVVIVDGDFMPVTGEFIENVQNLLDPFEFAELSGLGRGLVPIGHRVDVTTPEIEYVDIDMSISLVAGAELGHVESVINEICEEYIAQVRRTWVQVWENSLDLGEGLALEEDGQSITHEFELRVHDFEIMSRIANTRLVSDVQSLTLNGVSGALIIPQTNSITKMPKLGDVSVNIL